MISNIQAAITNSPKRPRPLLLTTVAALAAGALTGWWMTPELAVGEDEARPAVYARAAAMQAYPGAEPQLRVDVQSVQPAFAPTPVETVAAAPITMPVAPEIDSEPAELTPTVSVAAAADTYQEPNASGERVTVAGGLPEPLNPSVRGANFGCDGPYASELIGCSTSDAARARPRGVGY